MYHLNLTIQSHALAHPRSAWHTADTMSLRRGFIILVVACLLFGGGYGVRSALAPGGVQGGTSQTKQYPLLARRIFIDNPNDPIINFANLRTQLNDYFQQNNISGSLYFEYLPTGTSARIDADSQQVAASLMKLPAAMDAYKARENGKVSFDKIITLQPSWLDAGYGDLYKKGAGYQLTLGDAVKIMLENSDNTALKAVTLTTFGMVEPADSVLNAVDVDLTQNPDLTVSVGARSYASFMKCLYFACFNNYEDSQQILNDLTNTPFDKRMTAQIPDKNITIAHKIGVYDTVQSDCGIVYIPNRNYVFCAMIRGDDNDATDAHIAKLSKLVYDYVKRR